MGRGGAGVKHLRIRSEAIRCTRGEFGRDSRKSTPNDLAIRAGSLFAIAYVLCISIPSLAASSADEGAPELSLSQAIQIALKANRPVQIAELEITKARLQVASTKTLHFPQITTDVFGSGNITSPAFTFKAGTFETPDHKPVPAKDTTISLSQGFTGFAITQVAQPLTQLYQIHLAVREQELSADLAQQKYHAQRQSVVADIKQAYYATLQTESALETTQALVKQYQETDRMTLQYVAQQSVLESSSLDVKANLRRRNIRLSNCVTPSSHRRNT